MNPNRWRTKQIPSHLANVQALHTSVDIDKYGNVRAVHRGHGKPPPGFLLMVDTPSAELVNQYPERANIERLGRRGSVEVARAIGKERVHFTVDDKIFLADGQDMCIVTVGSMPQGMNETYLHVNGREFILPRGEVLEITATEPGLFIVELVDRRVWSRTKKITVRALENTPLNQQMMQAAYDDPQGMRGDRGIEIVSNSVRPQNRGTQRPSVTIGRNAG